VCTNDDERKRRVKNELPRADKTEECLQSSLSLFFLGRKSFLMGILRPCFANAFESSVDSVIPGNFFAEKTVKGSLVTSDTMCEAWLPPRSSKSKLKIEKEKKRRDKYQRLVFLLAVAILT